MPLPFDPQVPRTLRLPEVRERRLALLGSPHVRPLTDFAERLRRARPDATVPHFDLLDGAAAARVLFLFAKPGPKTDAGSPRGSGFVSRDNDGRTAEWTFRLMRLAGVPRSLSLIWNMVPWWDRRRAASPEEVRGGVAHVRELVARLPLLDTVLFVGEKAARSMPGLRDLKLRTLASHHPSPGVRAERAAKWLSIPDEWSRVMEDR